MGGFIREAIEAMAGDREEEKRRGEGGRYLHVEVHVICIHHSVIEIVRINNTMASSNDLGSSSDQVNDDDEEGQFQLAFGEPYFTVSQYCRNEIQMIKNNDPNLTEFEVSSYLANSLSDLAWDLLGRYMANSDYLKLLDLACINLSDETTIVLFNSLVKSSSLDEILLCNNEIGMDGVRSMVPFLKNASALSKINLSGNRNIKTEGFEVLINALDGGPIVVLNLNCCNIGGDISVLGNCTLPHLCELRLEDNSVQNLGNISSLQNYTNLQKLYLESNKIGREGCIVISNLLQNEESRLEILDLDSNDIDDEGAEILAASLKHNNTLSSLYLRGNNIKEKGRLAFLKLLNDVSSIDSTFNSNHTLVEIIVPKLESDDLRTNKITGHLRSATTMNEEGFNVGRTKVIICQLNSDRRMELSRLQTVPYSYNSIFSDIDALVLPEVLALVGQSHGQTELYRMLIAVVPDLSSTVNRKVILQQKYAEMSAQMEAIRAKMVEINTELALIARKERNQSAVSGDSKMCGKKRERSANSSY